MSIESILVVILYSAKPYLWLIILLVLIPIICYLIKIGPLLSASQTKLTSIVVGIIIALLAPYIMVSKLEYVTTVIDWVTLIGVLIGASIYCWISLTLLFKPIR